MEPALPRLSSVGAEPCPDGQALCATIASGQFLDLDPFDSGVGSENETLIVAAVAGERTSVFAARGDAAADQSEKRVDVFEPFRAANSRSRDRWRIWGDIAPSAERAFPVVEFDVDVAEDSFTYEFDLQIRPNVELIALPLLPEDLSRSSPYGVRNNNLAWHEGIDYAVEEGKSVFAMHGGVLDQREAGASPAGNRVVVSSGFDWSTRYLHLWEQTPFVAQEGRVDAGAEIGKSGNTGRSTGPHLHIDLPLGSIVTNSVLKTARIDPSPFLPNADQAQILANIENPRLGKDRSATILAMYGEELLGEYALVPVADQPVALRIDLAEIDEQGRERLSSSGLPVRVVLSGPRLAKYRNWTLAHLVLRAGDSDVVCGSPDWPLGLWTGTAEADDLGTYEYDWTVTSETEGVGTGPTLLTFEPLSPGGISSYVGTIGSSYRSEGSITISSDGCAARIEFTDSNGRSGTGQSRYVP